MVKIFDQAQQLTGVVNTRWQTSVGWARKKSSIFDHFWRMKERYSEVLGGRLAAAISYYGFFAVFALGMIAYAVTLQVFAGSEHLIGKVNEFLENYFASLRFDELKASGGTIATVGLISLVFAGIGWVDALRSSQRAVWKLDQHPGNFLVLRVTDLALLILVGVLMAISLTVIDGLQNLFDTVAHNTRSIYLTTVTIALTVLVNMVIGLIMMTVLPRIHMSPRRLFFPVLMLGAGLTLLTSIGRVYAGRTESNPAYVLVASSVGLLVYLYLFNQILLWSAALAATSTKGRALDLAWGKPRAFGPDGESLDVDDTEGRLDLSGTEPPEATGRPLKPAATAKTPAIAAGEQPNARPKRTEPAQPSAGPTSEASRDAQPPSGSSADTPAGADEDPSGKPGDGPADQAESSKSDAAGTPRRRKTR